MGVREGVGWVEIRVSPLIKGTFMKNLVSYSVEWSSKNFWNMTPADVKTDVKW